MLVTLKTGKSFDLSAFRFQGLPANDSKRLASSGADAGAGKC